MKMREEKVLMGSDDTKLYLFNSKTGEVLSPSSPFHKDFVRSVSFTPNSTNQSKGSFVSGSWDKTILYSKF